MAKRIQVDFFANMTQFNRSVDGAMGKLKSFVGLGEMMKGALVSALGGITLGAIVEHTTRFAKSIQDASKSLGISVGQVMQLRRAAAATGMEFNQWEIVQRKTSAFLRDVYNRKPAAVAIGASLGITPASAKTMPWIDAFQRALERNAPLGTMTALTGKNAQKISNQRENILEQLKRQNDIDAAAIDTMARFRLELQFLIEELESGVLPALAAMADWIMNKVIRPATGRISGILAGKEGAMAKAQELGIKRMSNLQAFFIGGGLAFFNRNLLGGDPKKNAKEFAMTFLNTTQDQRNQLYNAYLKGVKTKEAQLAEDAKTRQQAREARIAELKSGARVNRVRDIASSTLSPKDFATNQFLKIGGLMGVDVTYRLERLQITANEYLRQIAENTSTGEGTNAGTETVNPATGQ